MPCPHDTRQSALDALPFDSADRAVLTIARHVFRSFAVPQGQAWLAAVAQALAAFDHDTAPHVFVATLGAVQTMRQARRSVFHFNDPTCPHCAARVTEAERLWLSAVQAMRRGDRDRAAAFATLLCEGNDSTRWLMALRTLADILPPLRRPVPALH